MLLEQTMEKRYAANPNFLLREIGGEAVLVPLSDAGVFENTVLSLNETCRFLWQLFQTPTTVQEAIDAALEAYEGSREEIVSGVCSFVYEYARYGLLKEEQHNE